MRAKSLSRALVLLAVLTLTAGAVWAQPALNGNGQNGQAGAQALAGQAGALPADCGAPPSGRPWGCELKLDYPPAVRPSGGVVSTTLVMQKRDLYVPVWAAKRCKGTLDVCLQDGDCGGATGSCATGYCDASGKGCAADGDCGTGGKCAQGKTWGWQKQALRTYGHPLDGQPVNPRSVEGLRWGYPGPTLYARTEILKDPSQNFDPQTNPALSPGTRIKVKLHNQWEPQSYEDSKKCNGTCDNSGEGCAGDGDCGPGGKCLPLTYRQCTKSLAYCGQYAPCAADGGECGPPKPVVQKHPNCFHGERVTNLHFHGTHVSPQRPQDFVLLNLFPEGSQGVPSGNDYAVGDYQVDINPLPWNQAPGTHYYHPHKHGSTSLQVQEGMAGALIIEGPFDDWLGRLYGGKLVDRLLILQQISERDNFFTPGFPNYPPKTLVNGSATPVITMRPGEIQRWRFIGATTQVSASLEIGFDPRIRDVRQIAQDGVQFAWQNYERQPLRDAEGTYKNFTLSPGNRADFLVKAPDQPGTYSVNSYVFAPGDLPDTVEAEINPLRAVLTRVPPTEIQTQTPPIDQKGNPLLFTIQVGGPAHNMEFPVVPTDPACKTTPARCWPATPSFLADLEKPGTAAKTIKFKQDGNPGTQPSAFYINDRQYEGCCAGVTMERGATQDWIVSNVPGQGNSGGPNLLPHPFHIHINPFQVSRIADRTFDPPYIWWDTMALPQPNTTDDEEAGPIWNNEDAKVKCPRACQVSNNATWNGQWKTTVQGVQSVCGCTVKSDSFALRQRFDDYTGGYVIHCHFLGHEDRGMMVNVQTVCDSSGSPGVYGQTQANGGADNCPGTTKALPACGTVTCPSH
jgi:FtsP/CotA-like multicopper oxidase with cupredoxin domain